MINSSISISSIGSSLAIFIISDNTFVIGFILPIDSSLVEFSLYITIVDNGLSTLAIPVLMLMPPIHFIKICTFCGMSSGTTYLPKSSVIAVPINSIVSKI